MSRLIEGEPVDDVHCGRCRAVECGAAVVALQASNRDTRIGAFRDNVYTGSIPSAVESLSGCGH